MTEGDPRALREAADQIADLVHDLGKYVHLSVRILPPEADLATRWQALREDLLETRRGPSGAQPAATVYAERRSALPAALDGLPALVALDAHMQVIRDEADLLRAPLGPASEALAARLGAAARGVQAACRALQAAARSA